MNIASNSENTSVKSEETKNPWSDLARIQKQIPAAISEYDAVSQIAEQHGLDEHTTFDMRVELAGRIGKAQAESKASVGFSKGIATRHTLETLDRLPDLSMSDYSGIIALRAPLGSGKTQTVGASFVNAIRNIGRVACITHLRSLVAEMARRLKAAHYEIITETQLLSENALAITSASLCNGKYDEFFGTCYYLFIDEFSQVRRFFAEDTCGNNPSASLAAFRRHIAAAKCVIVADADLSDADIHFLESCRAEGERFRVIDAKPPMLAPDAEPDAEPPVPTIDYIVGEDSAEYIIGAAEQEILKGGNVWIGCESAARAATFGEYLKQRAFKVLTITSEEKSGDEQEAFLSNPDEVSRQYQAIVHSPVISSGVSIEHKGAPHFTAVFWIGGGRAILPSDAGQALRRVRYLNHAVVGLLNNSEGKVKTARSRDEEYTAANGIEPPLYDRFCNRIGEEKDAAKAAFMSRFVWQRKDAGYTLNRLRVKRDPTRKSDVKGIRTAQIEAKREALKAAPQVTASDAEKIERDPRRTKEQAITLEAYKIRAALNVPEVTDEAIDLWDDGWGIVRLARFMERAGIVSSKIDPDKPLSHQRDSAACVKAYAVMWDGIPFDPAHTFRREEIETIYQRCKDNSLAWSWLGIIPKSVQAEVAANGSLKFPKKPAPNKFMRDLLGMMGLSAPDAKYQVNGKRTDSCRIGDVDFQAMTYAMQRLKVGGIPYIYNTKLGVSPPLLEPEHATPAPANDVTKQSVVSAAAIASLQEIAERFRGLKCSTRASVWVAGQEVILPVPDSVAATNPREIVLDGVPVMWPWDYSISDELLEMVRRYVRSYAFHDGQNICLLRPRKGAGSPEEIIRALRGTDTAA